MDYKRNKKSVAVKVMSYILAGVIMAATIPLPSLVVLIVKVGVEYAWIAGIVWVVSIAVRLGARAWKDRLDA